MIAKLSLFLYEVKVDQTKQLLRIIFQEWFSFALLINKITTRIELEEVNKVTTNL